jgi:hypothetical protein
LLSPATCPLYPIAEVDEQIHGDERRQPHNHHPGREHHEWLLVLDAIVGTTRVRNASEVRKESIKKAASET